MSTTNSSTRTTPRPLFPSLERLRKPMLFEGKPNCLFAGMIVDAAKPLAGIGSHMIRGPLELCDAGSWRQFFMAGNILIEFFWNEKPTGPRYRGDYYHRNPDHVVVSRGAHLGPSNEELRPESQVLETMRWMLTPL